MTAVKTCLSLEAFEHQPRLILPAGQLGPSRPRCRAVARNHAWPRLTLVAHARSTTQRHVVKSLATFALLQVC